MKISETTYGLKVFTGKDKVILDIEPMKTPIWLSLLTLSIFTALIIISPPLFKVINLIILLVLF